MKSKLPCAFGASRGDENSRTRGEAFGHVVGESPTNQPPGRRLAARNRGPPDWGPAPQSPYFQSKIDGMSKLSGDPGSLTL
jgi:hypothetical protein